MRHRPYTLTFLTLFLITLAFFMPVQAMLVYGHDLSEWSAVLNKLTWLNWMVAAGMLSCAALLWRASPHSQWSVPLLIALVGLNNYYVGSYATDFSQWVALMATLGFLAVNVPLMGPQTFAVLRQPERRWWLTAPRRRLVVPVAIEGTQLAAIRTDTHNVSESGAFVPMDRTVGVGDWITMRLNFGSLTQFRCQGRVVRRSEATGDTPAGIGIEFMGLPWRQRRELRKHIARAAEL